VLVKPRLDVRFEATDKRIDILLYVMIAMLIGIFGLIGFVLWDRQASVKPILQENKELAKEIQKLEQRQLKLEEKLENYMKKIAQIDPRFTGIL
jgi:Tfp pilus assembly protein PilN